MIMALATLVVASAGFYLKDGDSIVFYGDSITEHQRYTAYIEAFVRTRMPKLKVKFQGAGWAGDSVYGGNLYWDESGGAIQDRVSIDVAPRKPTVVTMMLGMNDGYYCPYDVKSYDYFMDGYKKLIAEMHKGAPQARLFFMSPSPWDDYTRPPSFCAGVKGEGGYDLTLYHYAKGVEELAKADRAEYVDLHGRMAESLKSATKENPKLAQTLVSDLIHPDWSGAILMAVEVLDAWKAPSLVSDVTIDAKTQKVVEALGAQVKEVRFVEGTVRNTSGAEVKEVKSFTWMQKDDVLPFPFDVKDPASAMAMRASRLSERLNNESIHVTGLKGTMSTLLIDGHEVGTFSTPNHELWLDLTLFETPMNRDAMQVLNLVKKKNNFQQARWRQVERPFHAQFKTEPSAVKAMIKLEDEIVKEIGKITQPKWHTFEIKPL